MTLFRSKLLLGLLSSTALMSGWTGMDAAQAAQFFAKGDVMASTSGGAVTVYDKSLGFVTTLSTGLGGYTTGSAFDKSGNFYVTDFSAQNVSVFSGTTGALTGTFGSGYHTPESILFNKAGDAYVSGVSSGGINHYDSSGNPLGTAISGTRTDWIELHPDQMTMFYTDESSTIHEVNVVTNTALPDFGSTFGTRGFALREIPVGPMAGDVLVAAGNQISLLSSSDTLLKSYTDPLGANGQWFALNLDPNGTSFWSGDSTNGEIAQFDIASGAVLQSRMSCGSNCLYGLSVAGEITGGGPPPVPEPATWAMMLTGFAGLGLAGYRRAKRGSTVPSAT
jgi:DNA-binding beta-propeller fold protein YncE